MLDKKIISEGQKTTAEIQIRNLRKEIDYNTRDYTIDFLIQQFRENEFYIPDEYQRQYIWNEADKNRFIESVLLGLPIPLMFFLTRRMGVAKSLMVPRGRGLWKNLCRVT